MGLEYGLMRLSVMRAAGSGLVLRAEIRQSAAGALARLRLTPADGAPLPAGRYLLRVSMAPPRVPEFAVGVVAEGAAAMHAAVDAPHAPAGYAPVVLTRDAPALIVTANIPADTLSRLSWRLQPKGYAAFYGGLSLRFVMRLLVRKESYAMFREALRRNGIRGFGAAARRDWAAAMALPARLSGFTGNALDYPEATGAPMRPPFTLPALRLIADFSRGAEVPGIDDARLARARMAGFSALCLPCGWDGEGLLLPRAVRDFLDNPAHDFPFFLRRTDVPAEADAKSESAFVAALAPLLRDARALRVETRSVLAAPAAGRCADIWDEAARETGADIFFAEAGPAKGVARPAPADDGARLPDTPPALFGRAVHATIGTAVGEAERRGMPGFVFVDMARRDGTGPGLDEDPRFGHAWTEALRVAQARHAASAARAPGALRAAVAVHAFYPDVFGEILATLVTLPPAHKLFVTTVEMRRGEIERQLAASGRDYTLRIVENRGRDILPFLGVYEEIRAEGFDLVAKIHTKKSVHRKDGENWRRALIDPIAGGDGFARILAAFAEDATLGMTGPDAHLTGFRNHIVANEARVFGLARRLGLTARDVTHGSFFAGSMFVSRVAALAPLMSLAIGDDDFELEAGQLDGTLAHAIERGLALSVVASGMRVAGVEDVLRRKSILWNMSG
ncbi:MAG: hypothetical protein KF899_00455 [Parvibaculum sp.]|nr:hypothetical protein [Parvibaculum sp.]